MGYSLGKEVCQNKCLTIKSLVAELMGTMLLVIFGCGAAMEKNGDGYVTKVGFLHSLIILIIIDILCF